MSSTCAGLRPDAMQRVLGGDGQAIAALFAVGNAMASVMDGHYPSGGITLRPGMTFGYLAGLALVGRQSPAGDKQPAAVANCGLGQMY